MVLYMYVYTTPDVKIQKENLLNIPQPTCKCTSARVSTVDWKF